MSYLPLARKWRPQSFTGIVGQEAVTTTLTNAIKLQRVAHAYLFAGPRGVGKTSTARILAKCLNCAQGPTPTPCQECVSCRAITQGSSLDVLEIDGASNRGIDQIRELRDNVKFLPSHGQRKVYIIDEVHQITADGFNALLKTLEEPPPHVVFIFATTHPEKVLPTILSRCQRFDFRRVPVHELVDIVRRVAAQEQITVEAPALFAIAKAADGSVRDAESLLDQVWNFTEGPVTSSVVGELLGLVEHEALLRILSAVLARDAATALRLVDQWLQRGKEVTQISAALVECARQWLLVKSMTPAAAVKEAVPWDELERLVELPREGLEPLLAAANTTTMEDILYIAQLLARTHETIRHSQHGRLHLELLLVKLAARADFTSLRAWLDEQPNVSVPPSTAGPSTPTKPLPARAQQTPHPTAKPAQPAASPPVAAASPSRPAAASENWRAPAAPPQHEPHAAILLEHVEQVWERVIEEVGRRRMSVASCLNEGKPLELVGDKLVIGVPDKSLHRELVESPENRRLIERVVAAACAVPRMTVAFRAITVTEVPPAAPPHPGPHAADIVQSALKMFNAKVIQG